MNNDYKKQLFELNLKYKKINSYKIHDDLVEYLKKIDKDNELTEFLVKPVYHKNSRVVSGKINYVKKIIKLLDMIFKDIKYIYKN